MEDLAQFGVSIAALASLLGLWAVHTSWRAYSTKMVMNDGLLAQAEVLGSRWWRNGTMVKFQYHALADEQPIVAKRLLENTFVTLSAGDRIGVKYLPRRPRFCVLVDFAGTHDAR